MDEESAQVFLPSRERCFERLRLARFGETVTCPHCGSENVVKRGTTQKDAQQYWSKDCETYLNDLTNTISVSIGLSSKRCSISSKRCDLSRATLALAASRCLKRQTDSVSQTVPASAANPPQTGARSTETDCPGSSLTHQQCTSQERGPF